MLTSNYEELGLFCELLPGELLYSAFARYQKRMRYSDGKQVVEDLIGKSSASAVIDLPVELDYLVSKIPLGHSYTADQLIDRHTLLPFYSPFLPPARVKSIREAMKGSSGSIVHGLAGIVASKVPLPTCLRFCPICLEEDKQHFGETYWHRLHQIYGVKICPTHKVFLEDTNTLLRHGANRSKFISTNEVVSNKLIRSVDLNNRSHLILLKIAQEIDWLLDQDGLSFEMNQLYKKYSVLLSHLNFISKQGAVRTSKLQESFLNFYPLDVLESLHCHPKDHSPWLGKIVSTLKAGGIHHPLRHILLCQFLGYQLHDFFQVSCEPESTELFFGKGPWPCLDPTTDHYQHLVIEKCKISNRYSTGVFTCSCGFSYSRKGPDREQQDMYQFERALEFSRSWNEKLVELWNNSSLSVRKISQQLNVVPATVSRQAKRLSLKFPRLSSHPKSVTGNAKNLAFFTGNGRRVRKNHTICREQWLELRMQHPDFSRKQLRDTNVNLYDWLNRNDYEWFEDNLPASKKVKKVKDWESYDESLMYEVVAEAERIKNFSGKPIKVTVSQISSGLNLKLTKQTLKNLPKTVEMLSKVTETTEEVMIRRIQWSAECFCKEGVYPTQYKLLFRASIASSDVYPITPRVQQAIELALQFSGL